MTRRRQLRGIELRYVLTDYLHCEGHASVKELVEMLAERGFEVDGRASKRVSDALRWEMGHGRAKRWDHGVYGPGGMPRSTEHRIHKRVLQLRVESGDLSLEGGHRSVWLWPG